MATSKQPDPVALRLRKVCIDTYHENVAYLHRDCPNYHAEGFQALNKIDISHDDHRVLAVLNVVHDDHIVRPDELGLSLQSFNQLGLPEGTLVFVEHAEPPHSMVYVRKKMTGERLSQDQMREIIHDIAHNRYSKPEIAAFLVTVSDIGVDRDEILYLTKAMYESGDHLDWDHSMIVDKHCIGGIPGNRTSMVVVPIVAAFGLLCPKTSSRAITSPAGTADTMEVLAQVDLDMKRLHRIVREHHGCLAWGGTARLSPADDVLISVERPLSIDSPGQMVASILSKKKACGATHLLLDIPVGPTAKVRSMKESVMLRKLFEYVGDRLDLTIQVIITDGRQPIGNGIGPALEARDVMRVLSNHPDAPHDLREKSLQLAGRILEFDADVRGGEGYNIARDILDSGRAHQKMQAIIEAQGVQHVTVELGTLTRDITAPDSGYVTGIDNFTLAKIARLAGAPMDKGAGIDLLKKCGQPVATGDPLYRIHAQFAANYDFACRAAAHNNGFTLSKQKPISTWN